jgi:rare lipoprotein A
MKAIFSFLCLFVCYGLIAQTQKGKGTFYSSRFWGARTSSGEPYHPFVFSAAHRTLPFGTWVEVELLKTGKKTIVRVNDRGPFIRGRVIDISLEAAKEVGLIPLGVSNVSVRPLLAAELDSLLPNLVRRDSLAKAEHPKPARKKSVKKKKRKKSTKR